jgi:PleD family two-component response regulator
MGVAAIDDALAEAAGLIKRADERLYEAKASGRNRVCA